MIRQACMDEKYQGNAIYEHCQGQGGIAYVWRQIERASSSIEWNELRIDELNKDYAFVLVGANEYVMKIETRNNPRLLKVKAFRQKLSNHNPVSVGRRVIKVADYWLDEKGGGSTRALSLCPQERDALAITMSGTALPLSPGRVTAPSSWPTSGTMWPEGMNTTSSGSWVGLLRFLAAPHQAGHLSGTAWIQRGGDAQAGEVIGSLIGSPH